MKRKLLFFFIFILIFSLIIFKLFYQSETSNQSKIAEENYNSNLLENVEYVSKDDKGNEYIIKASIGELDLKESNIIYLKNLR